MNKQESSILSLLFENTFSNQRNLVRLSGHSLGVVSRSLNNLTENGYLDAEKKPTQKAKKEYEFKKTENAIILAAGFGMRMVPINTEYPKALLEVKGEVLIERTIEQLKKAGIDRIYIVVGFMKEKFEYLIDKYGVKLIVNPEYGTKNNLYSLKCALKYLSNSYIIPCDIWCRENPYHKYEPYSWYMVSESEDENSHIRANRKQELVSASKTEMGNKMIGICYIEGKDTELLKKNILSLTSDCRYDGAFWEEALNTGSKLLVSSKIVDDRYAVEINTYEQLRDFDGDSNQLKSDTIEVICKALNVNHKEITDFTVLKKGMTNRSFLFSCKGKKYIMRIPGEGTDMLINRKEEADVYKAIDGKGICDDIAYINPENGYKITEFLEGARVCDPENESDIKKCMKRLRDFHSQKLSVGHEFNIFGQIDFYESLWQGQPSAYGDYEQTKKNVLELKEYIDAQPKERILTHIDAVPDNFLFVEKDGREEIRLIDWEYAGMQDPHVDIAMFCIYSLYERENAERLIDAYFTEGCDPATRIKIYCYIASCGLLWSNWCEYKRQLGVDFGEYSLWQYRYAKEYYKIAKELMEGK